MYYYQQKYCGICGAKRPVNGKEFDWDTGKKILTYGRCLVKDCSHGYHAYEVIDSGFFKNIFDRQKKCRICGNVTSVHITAALL